MTLADVRSVLLPDGPQDQTDELLVEVLDRCQLGLDTGEDLLQDALAAGPWALRSVEVSGFRGAANDSGNHSASPAPFLLKLPRASQVVVVHAANGTGKSTITDALEVALFGGTANSAAFAPHDLRQPIALHADATRCESTVLLDNDRGDQLRSTWRLVDGAEETEITWTPVGDPHGIVERPGPSWVETIAANHPVVGYDNLTHRLRAGRLNDFVHDTLSLGGTWWTVWDLLRAEHEAAANALARWKQVRGEVVTAVADLDEDLADQHPDVRRPDPLEVPATPASDIGGWFASTFGEEHQSLLSLNVDPQLGYEIAEARQDARASVQRYHEAREQSDQALWAGDGLTALRELVERTSTQDADHCPMCGEEAREWRDRADRTLHDLRIVREEFNLALADLTELGRLLVERLLPLLSSDEIVPEVSSATRRLRAMVEPLVDHQPQSDQDAGWRALQVVLDDSAFDQDVQTVLSTLASASDVLGHWQVARRNCSTALVAAQSAHGASSVRVDAWRTALDRVTEAFDRVHDIRRDDIEAEIGAPLGALLADVDFGGLNIQVRRSGAQGLNKSASLRLTMNGRDSNLGVLSAGQYNALVLALLLGTDKGGPFRFQVLDDPVHAFDEFRTDVFADLVARRAAAGRQIVLLTHDQQLVDVLRYHVPGLCQIKLGRDPHGNIVQIDVSHPWQPLIEDACDVLRRNTNSNGDHRVLSATTAGLLLLAFCRQALDAVLREFVIETNRGAQLAAALEKLDKAYTTRDALRAARKLVPENHPARPLITTLLTETDYLNDLNAGSHGDPTNLVTTPVHLTDRIDRTERFCSELLQTVGS